MKQTSGNNNTGQGIGLMSGTSLDGLDLAACEFAKRPDGWSYRFLATETFEYTHEWRDKLAGAHALTGRGLILLDRQYGEFLGEAVNLFIRKFDLNPGYIASHGHTVFHTPGMGITHQIGHPANIAAATGLPVVADFRTTDVALGGQGAPLVPAGDRFLFSDYAYCLNLGGFANISYDHLGERVAGDICPVNLVANTLAGMMGMPFDDQGNTGRGGNLIPELLNRLNQLPFYHTPFPRSLGREWVEDQVFPLLANSGEQIPDLMRTWYEHVACQISSVFKDDGNVLVTGGGAYNRFLMERLEKLSITKLVVPDDQVIQYKEALIFAFLGLMRLRNEKNCYRKVTGASRDSSCGAVYLP